MKDIELPPSEDLFMEVLAARARLGETIWTFGNNTAAIARRLEAKGLIHTMHGMVDKTFRAGLTEAGRASWLANDYTSPLARKVSAHLEKLNGTAKAAVALLSGLTEVEIEELGGVREG